MPLDYYYRLSARQQAIYRRSDKVVDVKLNDASGLKPNLNKLRDALEADNLRRVQAAVDELSVKLTDDLGIEPVKVKVKARRPRAADGEYYGLYEPSDTEPAIITVWMRTASRKQVVAYRTFLRTLIHEVCHHLDYTYLKLAETFHTEGFFKRESSLMRQLVPPQPKAATPTKKTKAETPRSSTKKGARKSPVEPTKPAETPEKTIEQLELF